MSAKEITDIPRKEISRNVTKAENVVKKDGVKPQRPRPPATPQIDESQKMFIAYQDEVNKHLKTIYEYIQQFETAFGNVSTIIAKHDDELTTVNGVVTRLSNNIKQELNNVVTAIDSNITAQIDYKINELLNASEDYGELEEEVDEELEEEIPENNIEDSEEE